MASRRNPRDIVDWSEIWLIFFVILFLIVWQLLFPRCGIQ
jgi:hypothetical protein